MMKIKINIKNNQPQKLSNLNPIQQKKIYRINKVIPYDEDLDEKLDQKLDKKETENNYHKESSNNYQNENKSNYQNASKSNYQNENKSNYQIKIRNNHRNESKNNDQNESKNKYSNKNINLIINENIIKTKIEPKISNESKIETKKNIINIQKSQIGKKILIVPKNSILPKNSIVSKNSILPKNSIMPKKSIVPKNSIVSKTSIVPKTSIVSKNSMNSKINSNPPIKFGSKIKINISENNKSTDDESESSDSETSIVESLFPQKNKLPKTLIKINVLKKNESNIEYKSLILNQQPVKNELSEFINIPFNIIEVESFYDEGIEYFINWSTGYIFPPNYPKISENNFEPIGKLTDIDTNSSDFEDNRYPLLKRKIDWFYHYDLDVDAVN